MHTAPGFSMVIRQLVADILVLVSEFLVVVILSEWWSVLTTADHCGLMSLNLHEAMLPSLCSM